MNNKNQKITPKTNQTKILSDNDKQSINKFTKEMSMLIKRHKIIEYAGVFMIKGKSIISYFPDDMTATRLLKAAHSTCRESVMQRIGG
jgi:putative methionine-R-sulfoxide reductase with GAF domain